MRVRIGKVVITRNFNLDHVLQPQRLRPQSEGGGRGHGRDREASSIGSGTELGNGAYEPSSEEVDMVTSEPDDIERKNTPTVLGRAALTTSSAGSSVHSWVSFDPMGREPSGQGLYDAPATSDSVLHGSDQRFAALCDGEGKWLAEHIPGPPCAIIS